MENLRVINKLSQKATEGTVSSTSVQSQTTDPVVETKSVPTDGPKFSLSQQEMTSLASMVVDEMEKRKNDELKLKVVQPTAPAQTEPQAQTLVENKKEDKMSEEQQKQIDSLKEENLKLAKKLDEMSKSVDELKNAGTKKTLETLTDGTPAEKPKHKTNKDGSVSEY